MNDLKYKGRTRAEWRALRHGPSDYTHATATEIETALLSFDDQEKTSRRDAEEQRFKTQIGETRRQNWWTRLIALAALIVSLASVFLSQCRESASPHAASSQPVSPPASSATTNSTPTGRATP